MVKSQRRIDWSTDALVWLVLLDADQGELFYISRVLGVICVGFVHGEIEGRDRVDRP